MTPRTGDILAGRVFLACGLLAAAAAAAVIGTLAVETARFFADVGPLRFFSGLEWAPAAEAPDFGVLPLLLGTARLAAGATLLALPAGLGAAIFLEYCCGPRARRALAAALAFLASVPAVVYGWFALNFVAPAVRGVWPGAGAFNRLTACLVVALMILPTIALLSRRALRRAPASLVGAGAALGAARARTLARLAVPAAWRGIAAAAVLALARAVGETMIVTLAAGGQAGMSLSPLEGARTLTTFLAQAGMGDLAPGSLEYRACFAVASVLALLGWALHAAAGRLDAQRASP